MSAPTTGGPDVTAQEAIPAGEVHVKVGFGCAFHLYVAPDAGASMTTCGGRVLTVKIDVAVNPVLVSLAL